ncbi:phosphotransferase family protein [Paeniglutamicibacter psychrophenolicus]|uniref:Aminoglycoside phosphotransferase (APT) family kinase protein n=1 Tax=Paeniglutamicibacter psychrophenolicus TaxID=257454 RepID=A0ABS4W8E9_9MICC|nr:phosphotransferase family protein [Paeniglutamicibacter psychrophenolicus]MBP2372487.1 aminoglycoside phosphotransferase (APT) family kinase protein [Paeniglutamicibacter psychrophenolicus]
MSTNTENTNAATKRVSPTGLDLDKLTDWLAAEHPGMVAGELSATLITGGKSNLTYELTDGTNAWIVRRPPLGTIMATAHDMRREYTMADALRGTDVPVAKMYAYCGDKDVLGADFYIMERIDGVPYRYADELRALGEERTRGLSTELVGTLAKLHSVDPAQVGLGDFGRPEGFLGRQVKRWKQQLDTSKTRELPGVEELHAKLLATVPAKSAAGIVHGDFRLDNVLMGPDDLPAAVIDWEMATLGDPLLDLALMLTYQRRAKIVAGYETTDPANYDVTLAPGYLSTEEIMALYEAESGRKLEGFGFHLGLACFKLAGISEGVRYRHINRQTVGEGFEDSGSTVPLLIELGLESLKEHK